MRRPTRRSGLSANGTRRSKHSGSDRLAQREAVTRELEVLAGLLDERYESIQPEELPDFRLICLDQRRPEAS